MSRGRPRLYSDGHRFIISVLWLRGFSEAQIGTAMRRYGVLMTRKSVSGQIGQTPFRGRDKMPLEVRQRFLDRLKAKRLDGGILPDEMFEAKP